MSLSNKTEKTTREPRTPNLAQAIIGLGIVLAVIVIGIRLKVGVLTSVTMGAAAAVLFAYYLGHRWQAIQQSMVEGISHTLVSVLILVLVGMTVATWLLGGTVQTLIYYGLKLISPNYFLVVTFILCGITSLATGTSYGAIATMGLALMGVGMGLGIPAHIVAGAVASGAFFGDKMSPLSDTTNVAAAITDTPLFSHIGSMIYTTGPASVVCIIVYQIINMRYVSGTADMGTINLLLDTLSQNYNLTLLTLIPPVFVIVASALRMPSVLVLGLSTAIGTLCAMLTQGVGMAEVLAATTGGYTAETGVEMVDRILSRGGVAMMYNVIIIIIVATAMGGVLERTGILKTILGTLTKYIKTGRGLVLATLASCYLIVGAAGNQLVSIILTGKTFAPAYKKIGIQSRVLSRTLEDSGTLASVILPWGGAAIYLMGVLDVGIEFIPYALLSFFSPLFAVLFAFTGLFVWKVKPEDAESDAVPENANA